MHSTDSNDENDGGLVDLGSRSSSVFKEGCGDVKVCRAIGVFRLIIC